MQLFRSYWLAFASAIALAAGVPQAARALTLAGLDAGGSFSVGSLTFSDFDVLVTGDVPADLSGYPVQLLADGFRLTGIPCLTLGEQATVLVSFVVESALGIDGASLFAPLVAVGAGAAALVSDSLLDEGGDPLATLLALNAFGDPADLSDAASFGPVPKLQVVKVISLTSGVVAAAPHVDQRFSVVPEPLTLAMLASGLSGLAMAGRRRAMVA
jgi:hypothetical protein